MERLPPRGFMPKRTGSSHRCKPEPRPSPAQERGGSRRGLFGKLHSMKYPWYDYSRRLSPLKLAVFIALFVPASWVAVAFAFDWLGARPLNEAIHQIGLWMLRFMFAALAVTPLRQIWQWPRLILVRRMLGVAAFAYGLGHFSLYCLDQAFDVVKIATEIALRFYLTIGFVALLGLAALAATSTDAMVRRMGRRWQ